MNAVTETKPTAVEAKPAPSASSKLKSLSDLPPKLTRCLSDGEIRIGADARREMILLDSGFQQAVLILADRLSPPGSNAARDLRARAAEKGYRLVGEYRADAGLIPLIYQRFGAAAAATAAEIDSEAQRRFDELVQRAAREGASDIHIILRSDHAEIRFRVHGELETVAQWTVGQTAEMCACAYNVLAGIRDVTWDPSRRQDANMARPIQGREYRLRYAHKPIYPEGTQIVLRLLSTGSGVQFAPTLQHLGYDDAQADAIEGMVAEPSGLIVISGETGSGKSTTLANLMHLLLENSGGTISLQTVEDPPEYVVPGVIQGPVIHSRDDRERGLNPFVEAIKGAMRTDPDILMIGEIRDIDTAVLAAQIAQSGHPVLSTVHARRALGIVERLEGMGAATPNNPINRALLCAPGFLAGLIHQTLIPVLCSHCARPFSEALAEDQVPPGLDARVRAVAEGEGLDLIRVRGPGCSACRKGVRGRTVCAEVVVPDPSLLDLLRDRRDQAAFDHWLGAGGGYSLRDHANDKMCAGLLSPVDVEAYLGRLRLESKGAKRQRIKPVKAGTDPAGGAP
jgi:general secretion pathway protein E